MFQAGLPVNWPVIRDVGIIGLVTLATEILVVKIRRRLRKRSGEAHRRERAARFQGLNVAPRPLARHLSDRKI